MRTVLWRGPFGRRGSCGTCPVMHSSWGTVEQKKGKGRREYRGRTEGRFWGKGAVCATLEEANREIGEPGGAARDPCDIYAKRRRLGCVGLCGGGLFLDYAGVHLGGELLDALAQLMGDLGETGVLVHELNEVVVCWAARAWRSMLARARSSRCAASASEWALSRSAWRVWARRMRGRRRRPGG